MTFSTTVEKQDEAMDYLSPTLTHPYTQQEVWTQLSLTDIIFKSNWN